MKEHPQHSRMPLLRRVIREVAIQDECVKIMKPLLKIKMTFRTFGDNARNGICSTPMTGLYRAELMVAQFLLVLPFWSVL